MHTICLAMTTPRSGTTFLAHSLEAVYGDIAHVFHEDIQDEVAKPKVYSWSFEDVQVAKMAADPAIQAHLDRIEQLSQERPYIDTGAAILPLLPLVLKRFAGRVKLIHLVRNPVEFAASVTTLGLYDPEMEKTVGGNYCWQPNPKDTRCAHPEFAKKWSGMTPFEKSLWRWAECHLMSLEVRRRFPHVPCQQVNCADLFKDAECLAKVAAFFDLPSRPIAPKKSARNATHPNLTINHPLGQEWLRYKQYAHVNSLAERLGVTVPHEQLAEQIDKYAAPTTVQLAAHQWRQRLTPQWWWAKVNRLAGRSKAS